MANFTKSQQGGNKMCKYIEFNQNEDGGLDFVNRSEIELDKLEQIIKDVDLVFGAHDIEAKDITLIERINMRGKVKLFFKYGLDEQGVIEKDIKRVSAEYYKLKRAI